MWNIAKKSGTKAARSALVDFLMQSGIEGSEEGAGDIADRIYDDLANGGMSEYNQNVRGYMQDGLSEKEAKSKANKDWWKQTGLDILAGSISGAVMGGGTHVLYSKASAEQAKATTSNFSPEDFGTLADNIESESNGYTSNGAKKYLGDAAKAARDISNVMKNGQTPSNSLYVKLQESMRNLLNSGKPSKPAEDVATLAEKRASKVRKMILDELDVAIENAKNATVDEKAKSTEAYPIKVRSDGIK